jgi:exodeoxyribonuclease VII large subunit
VARKDDFCAHIDRLAQRVTTIVSGRLHRAESRLRVLEARPGYAGFKGRVAMRGRHVSELTRELGQGLRGRLVSQARTVQRLRTSLEQFDLRRRLGRVRARLVEADSGLLARTVRIRHNADGRLRGAAARLDALSPLAVLGRGYAVCWNADRTAIIRDASRVAPGDQVQVKLAHGELGCDVREKVDG